MAEKDRLANNVVTFTTDAINKASDPALILFEIGYYQPTTGNKAYGLQPFSDEEVFSLISQAATKFPAHKALSAIKEMMETGIAKRKKMAEQDRLAPDLVGQEAPDFTSPDPNGKQISLSSFRGKYVLVDFWASWCGPCRMENPNVVKAYNKYKDKNFTILGVSLDQEGDKDKWLKAVKNDNLTWTQVSDLRHWDTPVLALYKFRGIPFNVLIDPQGKIIGQELRGADLEAKLAEVLK
jgi:peroxiredoxin